MITLSQRREVGEFRKRYRWMALFVVLVFGVIIGTGAGMVLRSLGSNGGLDVAGVILYQKFNIGLGKFFFFFNFGLFSFSFLTLDNDLVIDAWRTGAPKGYNGEIDLDETDGISLDFAAGGYSVDSPTSLWWKQLATAVVFGLGIATVLTLVVIPVVYSLIDRKQWQVERPAAAAEAAT